MSSKSKQSKPKSDAPLEQKMSALKAKVEEVNAIYKDTEEMFEDFDKHLPIHSKFFAKRGDSNTFP